MDDTVYKRSPEGKEIARGSEMKQLRLRFRDRTIEMTKTIRIGRDDKNDVVISDDPLVSRRHAVIENVDGEYRLKDLGSTNQTYLNNNPLPAEKSVVVKSGDIITIGHTQLQLTRF
ncbi:MAG TPA: FHA domain-containing protein [Spirochaetia bacterium]|nr:FHA domain-containing protein [Spirochaetia bacterium]